MRSVLKTIVLLIIMCVVILCPIDYIFTNNYGKYTYMMMREMYNQNNIDVLFLGSSHAYRSYDSYLADELFGQNTFNAGSSSQLLDQSYYLLKEISKTNNINTVYLDTIFSISSIETSKDDASVYLISDYMKLSWNKLSYLFNSGGFKTLANGLITARRNLNNTDFSDNMQSHFINDGDYDRITTENEAYYGNGFVYSYNELDLSISLWGASGNEYLKEDIPMSEFSNYYLYKIVEFCRENDIKLVLVDQPMPIEFLNANDGYDNYVKYMVRYCKDNNIDYYNFNRISDKIGLTLTDYMDTHHLNGKGARKYTRYFCDTIVEINKNPSKKEIFWYY